MAILVAWMLTTFAFSFDTIICTGHGNTYACRRYDGGGYDVYDYEREYLEDQIGYTEAESDTEEITDFKEVESSSVLVDPLNYLIWRK